VVEINTAGRCFEKESARAVNLEIIEFAEHAWDVIHARLDPIPPESLGERAPATHPRRGLSLKTCCSKWLHLTCYA
jgi:hypothetical protein